MRPLSLDSNRRGDTPFGRCCSGLGFEIVTEAGRRCSAAPFGSPPGLYTASDVEPGRREARGDCMQRSPV